MRAAGPLLVLCALLACDGADRPARGVVLLVVDTLRADHLGAYGYGRQTSPRIDAFAEEATLFANAVTPSPWTLPAVATLMTSLHPSVHGAQIGSPVWDAEWLLEPESFEAASDLDASRTTLAEILSAEGFETAGFVQGAYASRVFGFAQGFDRFDDNASPGLRFDVEAALAWLDERRPERFFVYLHGIEVHAPYEPPAWNEVYATRWPPELRPYFARALEEERARFLGFDFDPDYRGPVDGSLETIASLQKTRGRVPDRDRDHLVALYDRGVAYTDHWFGELLDGLRERGLYDETIVLLTSDHGEEFFEHAGLQHSRTYYEEVLRVPLVMRVPGVGAGRRVEDQAGLADVLPTLLDALGVQLPADAQGRSLLSSLRGDPLPERLHVGEASVVWGSDAVRTNEWKYVRGRKREELYDLRQDPGERDDRCARDPETCARLRDRLEAWREEMRAVEAALGPADAKPASVDAETRARLEALGYADDVSRTRKGGSAPSPR